jgi:electron-transferring-flavoprotein dehydrogenase
VKEIWKTKKVPQSVIHTLGWPLPRDAFGGSFMYPMGENKVALGLVVGLDYKQNQLDVHGLLQKLKFHPLFAEYLMGGEVLEWGAKTIPEGGIYSFPEQLSGDGILLAGDTVGMVNVPALKGIHYAMQAGIYAARAIFDGLKKKDLGQKTLGQYDSLVRESYIYSDLYKTRNMRLAFKSGFFSGGFKSSVMMVSGGALCGGKIEVEEDAAEEKSVSSESMASKTADVNGIKTLAKVDGVFLSGNKTRDHIPSHLIVGKDVPPEVADLYAALCPAGVYERRGQELVVNAPNCVDCKATDVLGPRWTPREGGSGPQYKEM